jgi:hypothetical protein
LNPKYYGDERDMRRAFETIRGLGCSFVVAGRRASSAAAGATSDASSAPPAGTIEDSVFLTLADVDVPESLRDLFEDLPGFRNDVSSTELRARSEQDAR